MDTKVEFGHLYRRESEEDYMARISQPEKVESSNITEEDKKLIIEAE